MIEIQIKKNIPLINLKKRKKIIEMQVDFVLLRREKRDVDDRWMSRCSTGCRTECGS